MAFILIWLICFIPWALFLTLCFLSLYFRNTIQGKSLLGEKFEFQRTLDYGILATGLICFLLCLPINLIGTFVNIIFYMIYYFIKKVRFLTYSELLKEIIVHDPSLRNSIEKHIKYFFAMELCCYILFPIFYILSRPLKWLFVRTDR